MSAARLAAYRVLDAVARGAELPEALSRIRDRLPDTRDRGLVTEVTAGVLRWQRALDHRIAAAANRPTDRLDPEVLVVLRVGAYQLLYLERVPPAAAVHQAVELVRRVGKASAAGLVNAVLRAIASPARRPSLPAPPRSTTDRRAAIDFLGITGSHPDWLVGRWLDRLGFETARRWVEFDNAPAPVTLRANRLRCDRDELAATLDSQGVTTTPTRHAADGLRVLAGHPLRTPAFEAGLFVVQDEASQLIAQLANVRPGERVLDACAAPGGKTSALAGGLQRQGLLVAADRRTARLRLLRETLGRTGSPGMPVLQLDLARGAPFGPVFDCVLVDAPCSGLGVLRRDPDIRWRRRAEDLERLAAVQRAMLTQAARVVRPAGRLVYATCSSEPEENQEVVADFLRGHADFVRVPGGGAAGLSPALFDDDGHLVTRPHPDGLEGFFGAVLQRLR